MGMGDINVKGGSLPSGICGSQERWTHVPDAITAKRCATRNRRRARLRRSKGQGGGLVTGPRAAGKFPVRFPVGTESEEPTHFLLLCEARGPEEAGTEPALLAAADEEKEPEGLCLMGMKGRNPSLLVLVAAAFSAGPALLHPRACACTWLHPSTRKGS